ESRARLGFSAARELPGADDAIFVSAAERFFRPEFFNRLDRIIAFRPLETKQLESIAQQLIADVFSREGLRRRGCLLNVSASAMARLVELGRNPQLGARALKRVVEREVAQSLAERLAPIAPGRPALVNFATEGERFMLRFQELCPVARTIFWPEML